MSRRRVEGNISYDEERGRFYAYFNPAVGGGGAGRRFTKTFPTLEEAREALARFERSGRAGLLWDERVTLREWLNYWLEDVVALNLEQTTYYCYKNIVKNHVLPAMGGIELRKLAPYHIQQYYTEMTRRKGLSPNTVHKHHVLLHTALKLAFRQGILAGNPIDRVDPPRERPAQRDYYTPQQMKRLLQAVDGTELELAVKLAGYLGLRRGEICGLRWEDVDLQKKIISIRRTRTTAGRAVVEKEPKTRNSIRQLSIGELDDLIALFRAARGRSGGTAYVLAQPDGTPWNPNRVTRMLREFVQRHNFPPITVHGLRHTFASVANSAHISLPDISRALGHRDVVITGRIYTHIFDQTHSEAVGAVAKCIREVS